MIKKFLEQAFYFVWNTFWVSISLAVIFINLMLLADACMALSSSLWIPTRARILSTEGAVSRARSRPYINIAYEYYVDGKQYTGKRVCFLELPFGCPPDQLEEIAKYNVGDSFTAYYAPVVSQSAVIFRSPGARPWIAFLISLPITWLGSWIAFLPGWGILKEKIIYKRGKHGK
ncbi:MAG: DUF3592 domain-containing protein [Anaerolineales bacterium]|nr:DUF3592 domain-containing protein [Anaerolineales bacterium]